MEEPPAPVPGPGAAAAGKPPGRAERRAFVVQVAADCDAAAGELCGRVQHLATCDGGNFASVDGLLVILRRILAEDGRAQTHKDPTEPDQ